MQVIAAKNTYLTSFLPMSGIRKPKAPPESLNQKNSEQAAEEFINGAFTTEEIEVVKPSKKQIKRVTVNLPMHTYKKIVESIDKDLASPSVSQWIARAIRNEIENQEAEL